MGKKWHTNKTKPNTEKYLEILVVWTDNTVSIEIPNHDDWGRSILIDVGLWKDVKDKIKYWQYIDVLFKKELEENNAE